MLRDLRVVADIVTIIGISYKYKNKKMTMLIDCAKQVLSNFETLACFVILAYHEFRKYIITSDYTK